MNKKRKKFLMVSKLKLKMEKAEERFLLNHGWVKDDEFEGSAEDVWVKFLTDIKRWTAWYSRKEAVAQQLRDNERDKFERKK